ncbi:hypothetical protein MAR_034674 [Mya arenaria]|uniref:DNA-directed DNA polymerase n=1 Tax=Mya arenaria TaxID=6604 RepID=A0ABY7EHY1_MYAAR|nr:hypothetical protein MAR_034674 [Mya arenaria]
MRRYFHQGSCNHTRDERAFVGTWAKGELKTALDHGYQLVTIYEIWHFDDISHMTQKQNLVDYLRIKQEASGWPEWCTDEGTKQMYIQQYLTKKAFGWNSITLRLMSLAMLMLNSFWGKFGQRSNLTRSTYMSEHAEFLDIMNSDQQEIKKMCADQIDWAYSNDFIEPSSRTDVVIAAYTTAYLHRLAERTIYCDTDSIVFTVKPEWEPQLVDFLGDLTDEVPGNNSPTQLLQLSEFPHRSEPVRGITLNFKNALDINYDTLHGLVAGTSSRESVKVTDNYKIMRNPDTCHIITKTEKKDYRIMFDKRVLTSNYVSVPYGF